MPNYDVLRSLACIGLATVALVGLLVSARTRACILFPVYLASSILGRVLILAWPQHFWTWRFTALSDAVQSVIVAAVALEIAYKVFRPLPRGFIRLRFALLTATLAVFIGFLIWPAQAATAFEWTLAIDRLSYGVTALFMAFMLAAIYYCVPIDPLHRDIVCGFALLSVVLANVELLATLDRFIGWGSDVVVKLAYPLLLAGWCVSAWRSDPETILSPETMRRLQPWRAVR